MKETIFLSFPFNICCGLSLWGPLLFPVPNMDFRFPTQSVCYIKADDPDLPVTGLMILPKKSPTGPTERTPKPEYQKKIAWIATERGPLGFGP